MVFENFGKNLKLLLEIFDFEFEGGDDFVVVEVEAALRCLIAIVEKRCKVVEGLEKYLWEMLECGGHWGLCW